MALTDRPSTSPPNDLTPRSRWVGARMSLDEFLALPEEETSLEFDDGLVTQKMAPQGDHGTLQYQIAKRFDLAGESLRLGKVFTETRFVTPQWSPVPDVSFYQRARIRLASRDQIGDFQIPPDIAVEIVSPSQSVGELLRKCLRYAELGVAISLVVDQRDRTIYDIRPGEPLRVLREDDPVDLAPVLSGLDLTVRALFDAAVNDWLLEPDPPAVGQTDAPD
ncbi:MAG: Uma2 family endonuclease [Chloroflexota bacterium]